VILDIIGNLVANIRQFQQFLSDQGLDSFFGQFSNRLVCVTSKTVPCFLTVTPAANVP
jgi:hypothetical protein